LQESCREWASGLFKNIKSDEDSKLLNPNFTHHYNVKPNKCFMLIDGVSRKDDNVIMKILWDYFDPSNFTGLMSRMKKEHNPIDCSVGNKICKSQGEWNSLVKPYMEQ